jgi:putative endonuclease
LNQQESNSSKEQNRAKGFKAEELAEELLLSKGFRIVKRNFHFGKIGEIDIIAYDKDILVFIEVKSTNSQQFGFAIEKIDFRKQSIIKKVANGYLYVNKITNVQCRFDVIAIDKINENLRIEHYENAFY